MSDNMQQPDSPDARPNGTVGTPTDSARSGLTPKGLMMLIAGGGATAMLVIIGIFGLLMPPAIPAYVSGSPAASGGAAADTEMSTVADLYTELNTALQTQDRELFFSYVDESAAAPLNRWWDNMDKFGWTKGGISVVDFGDESVTPAEEGPAEVDTIFGAAMGFSSFSPRGSGNSDAGLHFIQGMQYRATIDDRDGLKITGWESGEAAAVWDLAELYVAKGESSIVAGLPEEKELIDATVSTADRAARWVLDDFAAAGRELPLEGFNVFVTADDSKFNSWFLWPHTEDWLIDAAGFAIPMQRPSYSGAGVDPLLATGESTSTSVVSIGPRAMDDLERVLVHEFVHVVHYTEVSSDFVAPPRATVEGWARYQDKRFVNGGSFPASNSDISYCVAGFLTPEAAVPTDAQLLGADAPCYYELASTIYRFAEVSGYDPYKLARFAKAAGVDPLEASGNVAPEGAPALTAQAWAEWVRANY